MAFFFPFRNRQSVTGVSKSQGNPDICNGALHVVPFFIFLILSYLKLSLSHDQQLKKCRALQGRYKQ